MAILSMF